MGEAAGRPVPGSAPVMWSGDGRWWYLCVWRYQPAGPHRQRRVTSLGTGPAIHLTHKRYIKSHVMAVSGFIQNHKNPGAWLPQVQPLQGLLPTSHHINVRITGQIPVKPQSAWHWQRLLKSWKPYYVCICGRTPLQRNVAAHYRAHRQGKPFRAPGGSGHLCWSCRDLPADIY